jgi:hypothetical protein
MIDLDFEAEFRQPAVHLRGVVPSADDKHHVVPFLFLRCLSHRYKLRRKEPGRAYDNPDSQAEISCRTIDYASYDVFIVPDEACWSYLVREVRPDQFSIECDNRLGEAGWILLKSPHRPDWPARGVSAGRN